MALLLGQQDVEDVDLIALLRGQHDVEDELAIGAPCAAKDRGVEPLMWDSGPDCLRKRHEPLFHSGSGNFDVIWLKSKGRKKVGR